MRLAVFPLTLLLAGCASYGTWLDEVGKRPSPPLVMSDAQASALSAQATGLRVQAEAIRVRLASEADRHKRLEHYGELLRIGDALRPLESSLERAGRPTTTAAVRPAAA